MEIERARKAAAASALRYPVKGDTMANYSRWDDIKRKRPARAETAPGSSRTSLWGS